MERPPVEDLRETIAKLELTGKSAPVAARLLDRAGVELRSQVRT